MRYHQKALYYKEAIEWCAEKMLTLEPNYHYWISSIELFIGTGRYIEAMDLIKKAIRDFTKAES